MTRSRWWPTSAPLATGLALTLAGVAAPTWSVTSSSVPASPAKSGGTVTLRLQNAPLPVAISLLTQQAEVVVANNKDLMDKTVTVNLKDRPIGEALDRLLTPNNIPWYRDKDGTYIINATPPESKAPSPGAPSPGDAQADSQPSLLPPPPEPPAGTYMVTEKIELQHLSPDQAMAALGLPVPGPWRRGEAEASAAAQAPGPEPSNTTTGGTGGAFTPANPSHALDSGASSGLSGGVTNIPAVGPYSFTSTDGFHRSPDDRDQFGQVGERRPFQPRSNLPGIPPPGTTGTPAGVPPGSTTAGTGGARGFVPPGIGLVAGLATDNSLLVQGTPDDIDELRGIVRLLDIAPNQVSIKVDIITVSASILRQFGASWQFFTREGNIAAGAGTAIPDSLRIDVVRGNVQAVIGALTTNGRGRVIASPTIVTQNNTPADISQGIITYGFTQLTTAVPGGAVLSIPQPFPVQAFTTLQVIPRVNRDGTITVNGGLNVSNVTRFISSPDGSISVPETNNTSITSFVRRVANGETLVIGGLNTKSEDESETRIPLLGDIPLVGQFFRQKKRSNSDTQLLIFITPNLVSEHANQETTSP